MLRRLAVAMTCAVLAVSGVAQVAAAAATAGPRMIVDKNVARYQLDADRVLYTTGALDETGNTTMHLYDLAAGTDRLLASRVDAITLGLSGRYAIYSVYDIDTKNATLYLYDLQTNQPRALATAPEFTQVHIAGSRVVWGEPNVKDRGADTPFFTYDLTTDKREPLVTIPVHNYEFVSLPFDGHYLAWPADQNVANAVDVTSHKQYSLAGPLAVPAGENGQFVTLSTTAAQPCQGAGESLSLWSPATGATQPLAKVACAYHRAAIHGDLVAWTAGTSPTDSLQSYNLKTGETSPLIADLSAGPLRGLTNDFALTDHFLVDLTIGGGLGVIPLGTAPAPGAPKADQFYTVAPGDMLWQIAQRYGVTLPELTRTNNLLNPDSLHVGDRLFLPYPVSPEREAYRVQPGDTLATIAFRFRTTFTNLQSLNPTLPQWLRAGQDLWVSRGPERKGSYQTYTVMPGDSLWTIARRAGVTLTSLQALNGNPKPENIQAGTLLTIRELK